MGGRRGSLTVSPEYSRACEASPCLPFRFPITLARLPLLASLLFLPRVQLPQEEARTNSIGYVSFDMLGLLELGMLSRTQPMVRSVRPYTSQAVQS